MSGIAYYKISPRKWHKMTRALIGSTFIARPVSISIEGIGHCNMIRAHRLGWFHLKRKKLSPYVYIFHGHLIWQGDDGWWYIDMPEFGPRGHYNKKSTRSFKRALMWVWENRGASGQPDKKSPWMRSNW